MKNVAQKKIMTAMLIVSVTIVSICLLLVGLCANKPTAFADTDGETYSVDDVLL